MKEEGENKFNQFDERIMDMERKILDMDKKNEHRSEDNKQKHVNANQCETVIKGFHSETTESEVKQLLKSGVQELSVLLNRSLMPSFTSRTTVKETSSSGQQTC